MMELDRRDEQLMAILEAKPEQDEVPRAAWWLVVEALRCGHALRRAWEGIESVPDCDQRAALAALLCEAVLDELPVTPTVGGAARRGPLEGRAAVLRLRPAAQLLGRLVISPRSTSALQLANAVAAYRVALLDAAGQSATPGAPWPGQGDSGAVVRRKTPAPSRS